MPYRVGISAGFWNIGKDPALLGLGQKAVGFGATGGVGLVQIDLERSSEFFEPDVRRQILKAQQQLKLDIGIHGEISQLMSLESAERRFWEQSQERLSIALKYSTELKFLYINIHTSNTIQLYQEERQLKPFGHMYQVVAPYGNTLDVMIEKSGHKEELKEKMSEFITHFSMNPELYRAYERERVSKLSKMANEELEKEFNAIRMPELKADMEKHGYTKEQIDGLIRHELDGFKREHMERKADEIKDRDQFKKYDIDLKFRYYSDKDNNNKYFIDQGEIGAYKIVAWDMYFSGDPLWRALVGAMNPEQAYSHNQKAFNAAVASKYIQGHLRCWDAYPNKEYLGGMSMLDFIKKTKFYILFEITESNQEQEGLMRLFDPKDTYHLIRALRSPWVKMCIDFEHMLQNKLNPEAEIPKWPNDMGKYIQLFHIGEPKPYHPAHIPLSPGSRGQEYIYSWLYNIRKKGFLDGWIIFERGGGRTGSGRTPFEVFENSVWVLRQIAKYLDRGIDPMKLPLEFYGISEQNPEVYSRSLVAVREHAWDPIEGLISIPEEKFTFLGSAAVQKGKAKEWERAKYR